MDSAQPNYSREFFAEAGRRGGQKAAARMSRQARLERSRRANAAKTAAKAALKAAFENRKN
jgi:general stress protein YciG